MKALLAIVLAGAVACAAPKSETKDTAAATVQKGIDSMAASAEDATHDAAAGGLKPTPPIFERDQRDSLGRPLPRPATTKRDSVEPPRPPQLGDSTQPAVQRRRPPR